MPFSLMLLNGPSPGEGVRLDSSQTVRIGRHHSCDIQIDDDLVSRQHARVERRADAWFVEDCGSTNGTQLNSQRIQAAALDRGDLIRIGKQLILFIDHQQSQEAVRFRTSQWKATTMIGRPPSDGPAATIVKRGLSGAVSRVVRDSAVLCRLANELHRRQSSSQLVRVAADALADGMGADAVACWRVGTDGRLRCVGRRGTSTEGKDEPILPRLAIDREKAIFFPPKNEPHDAPPDSDLDDVGLRICVPIPGHDHCLGAIECHQLPDSPTFDRSDLDFVMVVAYQVGLAMENLDHRERLEQANEHLRERVSTETKFAGSSGATQRLLEEIACVGPTGSTVLVLGESGSGKELIAQSIHAASSRADGPYVAVNCAASAESLLESELFGHEAGAFTGADRRRIGQFERAHRGTIFLDEVGEMSSACQAKVLRLLEGHPFERVGGEESVDVDVRIIAATHRDLAQLVRERTFREDLYYRLCVVDIRVPPLRDRGDDAVELASLFLDRYRRQIGRGPVRLSNAARMAIETYRWPGNVRQLRNSIERAVVLGKGDEVDAADLGLLRDRDSDQSPGLLSLKDAEKQYIDRVLGSVQGNKTAACKILDISRGTLYSKLDSSKTGDTTVRANAPDDSWS